MTERTDDLRNRWLSADLAACGTLASRLSGSELARFAGDGLASCCNALPSVPSEILGVVKIGRGDWSRGHAAFDAVRHLTLDAEARRAPKTPAYLLLFVAENAARVIYNATTPGDPFDDDSGAWLVLTMAQFTRSLPESQSHELSSLLWSMISGPTQKGDYARIDSRSP